MKEKPQVFNSKKENKDNKEDILKTHHRHFYWNGNQICLLELMSSQHFLVIIDLTYNTYFSIMFVFMIP